MTDVRSAIRWRSLIAMAVALTVCAPSIHAQGFGGFLKAAAKKKIANVVKPHEPADTTGAAAAGVAPQDAASPAATPVRSRYNARVLEMTPDVLDRFARALNDEAAAAKAAKEARAKLLTPEQADRCRMNLYQTSPERKKLQAEAEAAMDRSDMAAMEKVSGEIHAMEARACPEVTVVGGGGSQHGLDPSVLGANHLTASQYSVLKERIAPFCASIPTTGPDGARIPGRGSDIFYVYSATEIAALQPRCPVLAPALRAVM